ncbi:MAG: porin, partial [Betaproteobacteria bacterium]
DKLRRPKSALRVGAACYLAVLAGTALGQDDQESAEDRLKRMERRMDAILREVEQLRGDVAKTQRAVPSKQLETEVTELKGQVAEVKEQAAATDAKADQAGVRAYLGPGLVFEDPRGRWRLQVSGRAQGDFRAYTPDFANANTFSIRRARMGLSATVLDDYGVFVEEEFANQNTNPSTATATPILTFAYVDFNWFRPGIRFRAGQFKPFIGLDNTMLDLQTDFMERAFTQNLFGSLVYDRGVMTFGEPVQGLFYSAAVTNGTGQAIDESQSNLQEAESDGKDYTVRVVNNFAQTFGLDNTVLHFGGTYKRGSAVNSPTIPYRASSVQTEARGLTFFIPAAFDSAGANVSNINRTIVDWEGALAYKSYKIQGDYAEVRYSGTTSSPGAPVDFARTLKAAYVTLGWVLTGESYSDFYREGTFVRPRPRNNFAWREAGAWGLWELNARYSWFDGSSFNAGNPVNTGRPGSSANFPNITQGTNKAQALTLGLKWQPNLYTRIVLNLIHTKFDTPVVVNGKTTDYENAITTRAQIDF